MDCGRDGDIECDDAIGDASGERAAAVLPGASGALSGLEPWGRGRRMGLAKAAGPWRA